MAAYTTRAEIEAILSVPWLVAALTDVGNDGEVPDLFTQILANAASEIDGYLCGQYTVPFTAPYPAAVVSASRAITLWYVTERRRTGDDNPYKKARDLWLERLKDIGDGQKPLDLANSRFVGSAELPASTIQPPHWQNIADWGDAMSQTDTSTGGVV